MRVLVASACLTAILVACGRQENFSPLASDAMLTISARNADKDACKNGGWRGLGYRNQGQCVSDVVHNRGGKVVFVTSSTHRGDLGGLAGADAICSARAAAASLPGTYVAWLSTSTVDARDRLSEPGSAGFVRTDGALVAVSIADLLDGALQNPLEFDENGSGPSSFVDAVWTGTSSAGTGSGAYCSDWTSGSPVTGSGGKGLRTSTSGSWTQDGTLSCGTLAGARLYCFEI